MLLAMLLSGKLFSLLKKTENATDENIYVTVVVVVAANVVVVVRYKMPTLKLLIFKLKFQECTISSKKNEKQ